MQITITEEEYQELMRVKREYENLKRLAIEMLTHTKKVLKEATGGDINKLILGGTERAIITNYESFEQEANKIIEELLK